LLGNKDVQNARRQVKYYFFSAYDLYKRGFISPETMKIICDREGMDLLFDVVEPLEKLLHSGIQSGKQSEIQAETAQGEVRLESQDQFRFNNLRILKDNLIG
ncbi:MAG: hypothetical protein JXR85_09625, partial [Deltaproteobacteria bacterium]|nr:hypothetical protein [Deltaproteobacteria bacterium]